jgi:hypothetical protein
MTVFVVGATGATGSMLVNQLLQAGHHIKLLARAQRVLPDSWLNSDRISVIRASVLDLDSQTLAAHVNGCDAVASCLGHTLSVKGIFGKPRDLVLQSVTRICEAIETNAPASPVKVVLMNTAGNSNRDLNEPLERKDKIVLGLLRVLLPPHVDNENAADFLRVSVGQNHKNITWSVVRPDTLLNENAVSDYSVHRSPTRSALFNPGKTSRINVANFMARLISDETLWDLWKGQMPVIYNVES